jgi:hypothetical protein
MGGTPVVLLLVGLVFPITLIALAVVFDVAVVCWAAYRLLHDRIVPRVARVVHSHHWMPHTSHR